MDRASIVQQKYGETARRLSFPENMARAEKIMTTARGDVRDYFYYIQSISAYALKDRVTVAGR